MSTHLFRVLLVLFLLAGASAHAEFVLDGAAAGLDGHRVYMDEKFVGLVGDPLTVPVGQHTVGIEGDHSIRLSISLKQNADSLTLLSVSSGGAGCSGDTPIWRVSGWTLPTLTPSTTNGVARLVLSKPTYTPTTMSAACAPSSLRCAPRSMAVEVHSNPQPAQIWVENKMVASTNTTISVTFCEPEVKRNILVRLDGYRPCSTTISLNDHGTASVECTLTKPTS